MCGIFGAFSKNGISDHDVRMATQSLSHRGPDAQGIYSDEQKKFSLGHRRLSILDLSETANQPMYSACGGHVMVYNGEVYNFNSLRAKMPGFDWQTSSDSEVILELFVRFGAESFSWLSGMFSIAIYDIRLRTLTLVRDQMGIKPLFYYEDDGEFIFASELKAIVAYTEARNKNLDINESAIPEFLHLGFISEPKTIYQYVYKFAAAHFGIITENNPALQLNTYWKASNFYLTNPVSDKTVALKQYRDLLFDSVSDQMISDVPLGTFLSGGIDSSLVTAVASHVSPGKINTFSIGFDESKYDESAYAAAVAKTLGTDHHSFRVSIDDVMELVPQMLEVYDEPFADSSAFPTMMVSKLARQHVTVALSGDGGDELFQGYGMYTWANRLANPAVAALRKPLYYGSKLLADRYKRAGKVFNYPSSKNLHTHIFSQEQYYFSETELSELLTNPDFNFTALNGTEGEKRGTPAEQQAFWDFGHYLKDDLLVKVDRAGMAYSLETRVPLLDKRLVEFALNIDYNLKVKKGFGSKYLMKEVLYGLMPKELFDRPKRGFAIPLLEWLKGPLSWMIGKYLNDEVIGRYGFVNARKVQELLRKFLNGQDHLYNRIWTLIVLHWWLESKAN